MIIKSSEITKDTRVGSKARNLKTLKDIGLHVPDFVIFSSPVLLNIFENGREKDLQIGVDEILKIMNCKKFAVRSSSETEDTDKNSMAGQFKTILAVKPNDLLTAIQEVYQHAKKLSSSGVDDISIIVQEFIDADISGVAFTRNPQGSREMVIEYIKGRGDKLVEGKTTPNSIKIFWRNIPRYKKIPKFKQFVVNLQTIEKYHKQAQDIEWCLKGRSIYYLQSRPITSINKIEHEQMMYLDKRLVKPKNFIYAKTEISEIAPRPSTLTFDIIRSLYQSDGPIANVYLKYGVSYQSYNFLLVLGNELYSDRNREMKALFPERSPISYAPSLPPADFNSLFRTIKNQYFFRNISVNDLEELKNDLEEKINRDFDDTETIRDILKNFRKDYETIYNINLLTGISINRLELSLQKEKISIPRLLNSISSVVEDGLFTIELSEENLLGNTLELLDETPFVAVYDGENNSDETIIKWWQTASESKKRALYPIIKQTANLIRLREYGRYLAVRNINKLRQQLYNLAEHINMKEKQAIFFVSLSELLSGHIYERVCLERQEEYKKYNKFNLPRVLSSNLEKTDTVFCQGVSVGIAEGILVGEKEYEILEGSSKDIILYTKVLNPNLVKYFDKIRGIVSEHGSLLSHLAIIAREKKIPVVVNFSPGKDGINIGDRIEIDGENGNIIKK